MLARSTLSLALLLGTLGVTACDDGGPTNEEEAITTVTLSFAPMGGGAAVIAAFDDPDGDGGNPPRIDPINLSNGTTYTLTVTFTNKLAMPAEDITAEVRDEGDQHQLFFTGLAVKGPATNNNAAPLTHTYGDMDAGGLPIGLTNTMVAASGMGQMTLTLRHLPPVNDAPVKVADLATQVKNGGIDSIGGDTDAQVSFMVTVP